MSAARSPAVPPIAAARSMSSSSRSVLETSLRTVLSAPPSARRSTRSVSSTSMTMLPRFRKKRRRSPFAETSKFSAPPAPLKTSVSSPREPSTRSLPSPGSQVKLSSPRPRSPMSAPRLPSAASSPEPPFSVSGPEPPRRSSSSSSPSRVVASVSVNTPFAWSIRTRSSPFPASTSIAVNWSRGKARTPLGVTTSRVVGSPARRRSTISSPAFVPSTSRIPRLILASTWALCDAAA